MFKDKALKEHDGFGLYFGDSLFDGGKVKHLSMKYGIFGALVDHKWLNEWINDGNLF